MEDKFIPIHPADMPAEIERLRTALSTIVCAFCGHKEQRNEDTPLQMATHMADCEQHPMRRVVMEVQRLEKANTELVNLLQIVEPLVMRSGSRMLADKVQEAIANNAKGQ